MGIGASSQSTTRSMRPRSTGGEYSGRPDGLLAARTDAQETQDQQSRRTSQSLDQSQNTAYQRLPESGLATSPRLGNLHGDQRRMGGGYDLSQCKGALKGTMDRCEFTDKSLALSFLNHTPKLFITINIWEAPTNTSCLIIHIISKFFKDFWHPSR